MPLVSFFLTIPDLWRLSELGAHIDGLAAVVGETIVIGATKEAPVTGRKADVIQAAYLAGEAAARLIKAGGKVP